MRAGARRGGDGASNDAAVVALYTDAPADGVDVLGASWGGLYEPLHVIQHEGETPQVVVKADVYMPNGALAFSTKNASLAGAGAWGDRGAVEFYLKVDASDMRREEWNGGASGAWATLGRIEVVAEAVDALGRVLASSQPLRLLATEADAPGVEVDADGKQWPTVRGDPGAKAAAERGDWVRFVVPISAFVPVQPATPGDGDGGEDAPKVGAEGDRPPWNVLQFRVAPREGLTEDEAKLLPTIPGTLPIYSPTHFVSFFVDGVNVLKDATHVLDYGTMVPVVPALGDAQSAQEKSIFFLMDDYLLQP